MRQKYYIPPWGGNKNSMEGKVSVTWFLTKRKNFSQHGFHPAFNRNLTQKQDKGTLSNKTNVKVTKETARKHKHIIEKCKTYIHLIHHLINYPS